MRFLLVLLFLTTPALAQDYVCHISGDVVLRQGNQAVTVVGQWTGVAIDKDLVLSVAHPKTSGDAVVTFGLHKMVATVIKADTKFDLAVYRTHELHGVTPIKIAKRHPVRAKIIGFINRDRRQVEYQVLAKEAFAEPDAPFLVMKGEAFHGMSGSPVITEDGLLAGIQSGGDMEAKETHSPRVEQLRRFLNGILDFEKNERR